MAHTLTASWSKSSASNYVTVNDIKVNTPYELKNGDVIKIYSNNGDFSQMFINGNEFTNDYGGTLNLSNTDIVYEENDWGPTISDGTPVITINYSETAVISFKHHYKYPVLVGSGTYKFRPYTIALPKLATISGVSVAEKSLSFESVKNAVEYEVLLDGVSVGTVENVINYTLSWSWACTVFINDTQVSTGSGSRTTIKAGDKIKVTTGGSNYISTSFPDIPVNPFVDGTYTFPAQDISLGTISNPRVSKAQNITMILT